MKKLTKEEWLTKVPELIYKLKKDYGFYFSGMYSCISKDILEAVNPNKHKHKIMLYKRNQRFFLVVYMKNGYDIYYTNEYINDTSWNRVRYFLKKFQRAYDKAEELSYVDKDDTDHESNRVESTN